MGKSKVQANGYCVTDKEEGLTIFCFYEGNELDEVADFLKGKEQGYQTLVMGNIATNLFGATNTEPHDVNCVIFAKTNGEKPFVIVSSKVIDMNKIQSELTVLEHHKARQFHVNVRELLKDALENAVLPTADDAIVGAEEENDIENSSLYCCSMSDLSKIPFKVRGTLLADRTGKTYLSTNDMVGDFLGTPLNNEGSFLTVIGDVSDYQ